MKYIILFLYLFVSTLQSDTVGVDMNGWVVKNDSSIDPKIIQEVKDEVNRQKSTTQTSKDSVTQSNLVKNETFTKKQNSIESFFDPILSFAKKHTSQFIALILSSILLSYLLIFLPIINSIKKELENDEIEIKNHAIKKVEAKPQGKILNSVEYGQLKSELNESYIYKKEEILLSKDLSQEDKNREIVMLEWKYNQILNSSLPKLESEDAKIFSQGLKELLDEKESREITRVFFRDFLQKDGLDEKLSLFLKHILK